jgi:hypothetical protein
MSLKVNDDVLYFNVRLPHPFTPRAAKVTAVNDDGSVGIAFFPLPEEVAETGEVVKIAVNIRPYLLDTVKGNRAGSDTEWDWPTTGLAFVCKTPPRVIPQEARRAARPTPQPTPPPPTNRPPVTPPDSPPDGPPDSPPAQAKTWPAGPSEQELEEQAPRVPTPSATAPRTTMRLRLKPGVKVD